MEIIPAIDMRNGNCVRLIQGKLEEETIYSKDPVFIAKLWQAKGARRIHLVDLDGAFSGGMKHFELIKKIRESVSCVIEVGGGIRDIKTVKRLFDAGIDKVIFGTVAVYNSDLVKESVKKWGDRIIVGIDGAQNKAAIAGWKEITSMSYDDLIKRMTAIGVKEFIYTEISKDGMLEGPAIDGIKEFLKHENIKVIASGGVSSIEHVKMLCDLNNPNLTGMIIGKALYTEDIKLEEAIKIVNGRG